MKEAIGIITPFAAFYFSGELFPELQHYASHDSPATLNSNITLRKPMQSCANSSLVPKVPP